MSRKLPDCLRQVGERVEDAVGAQVFGRAAGIAAAPNQHAEAGGACARHVDQAVADHHRPLGRGAQGIERMQQRPRIGLQHACEGIAADHDIEQWIKFERREQEAGRPLRLVGAKAQPQPGSVQVLERRSDTGIGRGPVGRSRFIEIEKAPCEGLNLVCRRHRAGGGKRTRDQRPCPLADHARDRFERQRRPPDLRQEHVQTAGDVGGAVDQRAVEVEYNGFY